MKIAVIGATGTAGSRTAAKLREKGIDLVEISRSAGVDVVTGEGLREALTGVDVAIDTSSPAPANESMSFHDAITTAARNVVEACAAQQVGHLVVLSIVGIHNEGLADFAYYAAKCDQEEIATTGSVPTTLVKTTQWHEFATNPAAVELDTDEVRVQDWLIQPVSADTVAEVLVETATTAPGPSPKRITGPEVVHLPELTTKYLARRGDARPVRTVDAMLPALAAGVLLAPESAEVRGPSVDAWLETFSPAN